MKCVRHIQPLLSPQIVKNNPYEMIQKHLLLFIMQNGELGRAFRHAISPWYEAQFFSWKQQLGKTNPS